VIYVSAWISALHVTTLCARHSTIEQCQADREALEMDYKALERELDQERDKNVQTGGLSEEEHYRELRDLQTRLQEVEDMNVRLPNVAIVATRCCLSSLTAQ
jgi:hypothetical protein